MTGFKEWFEANNTIRVVSYDKTGLIVFDVNGKRYPYIMDAVYFYNHKTNPPFKSWMKYAPGRAFNFARKNGERADLPPKETPPKAPLKDVQGLLF